MLPGIFIFEIVIADDIEQDAEDGKNRNDLGNEKDAGQAFPLLCLEQGIRITAFLHRQEIRYRCAQGRYQRKKKEKMSQFTRK